jgi:hypothetical protein
MLSTGAACDNAAMHARIRLILADSSEAAPYRAARGAGMPVPQGRKLADLRASLDLADDLGSAPPTSFVSDPSEHHAEVTAYLAGQQRIPVVLGEGVADAAGDDRVFALHEIRYDSPAEAERITRESS